MQKGLQDQLVKILGEGYDVAKQGIIQVADIVKEQAPELVAEILRWNFTFSFLGFLLGILLLMMPVFCLPKLIKIVEEGSDCDYNKEKVFFTKGLICVALSLIGLVFGITAIAENLIWIKVWVAPKLFMLEYIARLIK